MFDVSSVFLLIFAVAFILTVVSFVLGVADLSLGGHGAGHLHAEAGHGAHAGHLGVPHDLHVGHLHTDVGHGIHVAPHAATDHGAGPEGVSPFNMATLLAFLTWFGGAGYLLTAHFGVLTLVAIVLAIGVGLAGAAVVFAFMVRVLLPGQTPYLRHDDYELLGTIGRLAVGIRAGGTGELVYSKGGTRRVASARTESGEPIERGVEVVVVRTENGVVYVEPFGAYLESSAPAGAERS